MNRENRRTERTRGKVGVDRSEGLYYSKNGLYRVLRIGSFHRSSA